MSQDKVLEILRRVGAIITDSHLVYTSGKHGSVYINKDAVYPHTADISEICKMMASKFKNSDVQVVAGPSLGGIILSQWVAHHLSQMKGKEILGVYTEKTPEKNQIFTRGYDKHVKGKKVLVVEDITTTGGSVRKVVDSVKAAGGQVLGVCVMVNRNAEINDGVVGAPFHPLAFMAASAYDEAECPLCKQNVPINTEVGKGREYLAKKQEK